MVQQRSVLLQVLYRVEAKKATESAVGVYRAPRHLALEAEGCSANNVIKNSLQLFQNISLIKGIIHRIARVGAEHKGFAGTCFGEDA